MPTSSTREIHIEFDRHVPMRDGITLSVDVYRPIDSSRTSRKYPVILTRTPYMKLSERMLVPAKYFAERGYIFVAMDVRGRGDSDGSFVPYFNEGQDGYDHAVQSFALECEEAAKERGDHEELARDVDQQTAQHPREAVRDQR